MKESGSHSGSGSTIPAPHTISDRCVLEETQLRRSLRDLEQIAEDGEIILEKIRQRDSGCPSDPLTNKLLALNFCLL